MIEKRSKLIIYYGIDSYTNGIDSSTISSIMDFYSYTYGVDCLWLTKEEAQAKAIKINSFLTTILDYQHLSKDERAAELQNTRKRYPNARYALLHMEKDQKGKFKYDVVEL